MTGYAVARHIVCFEKLFFLWIRKFLLEPKRRLKSPTPIFASVTMDQLQSWMFITLTSEAYESNGVAAITAAAAGDELCWLL